MSAEIIEIKKNLGKINDLYTKSENEDSEALLFYSKLAILELCGWIEESMDDIIREYAKKYLKEQSNINSINDTIRKTSGFDYNEHFREKMLIRLIGLINIEKLETNLDQKILEQMKAALTYLREYRDKEAHTYINIAKKLDAPSFTLSLLEPIRKGLKEIDNKLNCLS
ncbi:MAG TPA: hypothetical protein VFF54_06005 [Thermodesulfobacteriota bacterium]|nr:hypothetical protein [Thermodesulfobacteriota bacterium]